MKLTLPTINSKWSTNTLGVETIKNLNNNSISCFINIWKREYKCNIKHVYLWMIRKGYRKI